MTNTSEPDDPGRTIRPGLLGWALRHPRLAQALFLVPILAFALFVFVIPPIRAVIDRVRWESTLDDPAFRPRADEEGVEWSRYRMRDYLVRRLRIDSRTHQGTGTPVLLFEDGDDVTISREPTAADATRAAREWTASPAPGEMPGDRRHSAWGAFVFSGRGGSPGIDRILALLGDG